MHPKAERSYIGNIASFAHRFAHPQIIMFISLQLL